MQITIGQSAKVIKTGTNKQGGAWELIVIKSAKGTEYTTFDKKVKHLGAGSVIEIGEPEENNGKLGFPKIVEVITEVAPATVETREPGTYKRDTEGIQFEYQLKARLQQIERASIETQTAYNGIIRLAEQGVNEDIKLVFRKALKWAESRLDESMKPAPKIEPKPTLPLDKGKVEPGQEPKAEPEPSSEPFPNIGALLTWCATQGIDRAKFMEILEIKEKDMPKANIGDAHQVIRDYLKQYPKDPNDPGRRGF